jgi:hypothetical protein
MVHDANLVVSKELVTVILVHLVLNSHRRSFTNDGSVWCMDHFCISDVPVANVNNRLDLRKTKFEDVLITCTNHKRPIGDSFHVALVAISPSDGPQQFDVAIGDAGDGSKDGSKEAEKMKFVGEDSG